MSKKTTKQKLAKRMERHEAAEALFAWFESQDIGDLDSIEVMAILITSIIALKEETRPGFDKGMSAVKSLLETESHKIWMLKQYSEKS
jgi:hypothetical protein